jgi:single-strand DNA-binding protein
MANFNKVILMGNLTRDPELKYLPNNTAVCDFGMAINHRWRDKEGNQREEVCFVDVSVFGRGGEVVNQYMSKGKPILIEGRLKLDQWTAQDGQKRSKHTVVADNFTFVGARDQGGAGGAGGGAPAGRSENYGGERSYGEPRAGGGGGGAMQGGGRGRSQPGPVEPSYDAPPPEGGDIPF